MAPKKMYGQCDHVPNIPIAHIILGPDVVKFKALNLPNNLQMTIRPHLATYQDRRIPMVQDSHNVP